MPVIALRPLIEMRRRAHYARRSRADERERGHREGLTRNAAHHGCPPPPNITLRVELQNRADVSAREPVDESRGLKRDFREW